MPCTQRKSQNINEAFYFKLENKKQPRGAKN